MLSDQELIRRYRAGDAEALSALFARYEHVLADRVRRRLPPKVRRKVSVSDVLQETRIVAFDRRADFDGGEPNAFRNWIRGIADRKAMAAVRRYGGVARRNVFSEVSAGRRPEADQMAARIPSPSEVAIAAELRDVARRAMATLPADYREVLRLAREEQHPLREAAARMGRSYEATKKLYERALLRFTDTFERMRGRDA